MQISSNSVYITFERGRYVLQVAGCGLKFNYNWKTAGTQMKRTSGRLTVTVTGCFFDRTVRLLPPYVKPAEAMGGEYIPMILTLQ